MHFQLLVLRVLHNSIYLPDSFSSPINFMDILCLCLSDCCSKIHFFELAPLVDFLTRVFRHPLFEVWSKVTHSFFIYVTIESLVISHTALISELPLYFLVYFITLAVKFDSPEQLFGL